MNPLAHIAAHPLAHALGWTLLHFCWQGAAVAALLWCVLGALGRHSSRTRYAASCFALALVALLPLLTFARLAIEDYRLAMLTRNAPIDVATLFVQADSAGPPAPWPLRLAVVLDHCVPWVLALWLAGVLLFLARLNLGLLAARRMSSAGTVVSPDLQHLFRQLRARLGVHRAVRLLHSARVQVPTVIGWLRPVVLLPASCLTGLSPSQIEALLCHELAHIRRHDYLVSVIQSVVETLLFYHPAVWWVSRQVRRERECCCDELAVSNGGDVLAYARALSWLEEQRTHSPQLVLGANGGVLTMRIRRLLGYPESSAASQFASIALLAVILLAGVAFAGRLAYAESRRAQTAPSSVQTTAPVAAPQPAVAQQRSATREAEDPAATRNPVDELQPQGASADAQRQMSDLRDQIASLQKQQADHDARLRMEQLREQVNASEKRYSDLLGQYRNSTTLKNEDRRKLQDAKSQLDQVDGLYNEALRADYQALVAAAMARANARSQFDATLAAWARINTPEFRRQADNAMGPELRKLYADSMKSAANANSLAALQQLDAKLNSPEVRKQLEDTLAAAAKANSPEFRKQLDDAMKASDKLNTPEFRKQMEQLLAQRALYAKESAPPEPPTTPAVPAPMSPQEGFTLPSSAVVLHPVISLPAGVVQGSLIHNVDPVYPPIAKAAHVQGVVVLDAWISKEGTVEDVSPVSGPPMLRGSAIDAVRQWIYKPYMLGGQPVAVHTTVSVNFTFGKSNDSQGPIPATDAVGLPVRRIGDGVSRPEVIYQVQPEYTDEARKAKFMGTVMVQMIVNAHGVPENVHVLRGVGMGLDEKAVEAVSQYRFKPAMENGKPVPVLLNVQVNFRIFDSPKSPQSFSADQPLVIGIASGDGPPLPQYDSAGNPVRNIGGGVSAPAIIHQVNPEYTPEAKKAKFGGTVLVGCIVNEQGIPEDVHIVRGVGMGLNDKAVEAVKQYKFKPAMENGAPVPVELNIEVNFQIF